MTTVGPSCVGFCGSTYFGFGRNGAAARDHNYRRLRCVVIIVILVICGDSGVDHAKSVYETILDGPIAVVVPEFLKNVSGGQRW
jgi:hypothetical protein